MSYDFAAEIADARYAGADDYDDARYEAEQDALDDEREELLNGPCRSPYRCTDRMCGALDCSNCHPEGEAQAEPDELPMRCRSCGQLDDAGLCADCEAR